MTLIDRHVLREWFAILGLVLAATLGLLLMQAVYSDLEDLIDAGAGLGDATYYFAVKIPGFFAMVLPLALLVSLLYSLGRLHYGNEITAMRAAGLGLFRITRGIWAAGVFFCAIVWVLNATLVPWSIEESRAVFDGLRFRQEAVKTGGFTRVGLRSSVAFDGRATGRMWFFNRYSEFTRRGYGITVVELDTERREKTRIYAREGWRTAEGCWFFRDGREVWIDPASGEVFRTVPFAEKELRHYREDPALMTVFDVKPDNLSIFELRRIIRHYRGEASPKLNLYAMRYYGVLAETLSPLIIIAIAVPFAVAGVRVNPAVGVTKSIGLFVLYFLVMRTAMALGARDIVPPLWAAVLPSVALLGVGLWSFSKVR